MMPSSLLPTAPRVFDKRFPGLHGSRGSAPGPLLGLRLSSGGGLVGQVGRGVGGVSVEEIK